MAALPYFDEIDPSSIDVFSSSHKTKQAEEENGKKAEKVIHALLVSLFGDVKHGDKGKLVITCDSSAAYLDKQSGEVESANEGLGERVRTAFSRIQSAVKPIPLPPA